jgi:hypothetical protein
MRIPAIALRTVLFPLGKPYAPPQDKLVGELAQLLTRILRVGIAGRGAGYIGKPSLKVEYPFLASPGSQSV